MRYIHKTLLDHEQIVYVTHPHKIIFVPSVMTLIFAVMLFLFGPQFSVLRPSLHSFTLYEILAIFCAAIGLFTFLKAYIHYRTSEYGVTNKRVLIKVGLIQRSSLELFLDKIEAVHVDQTIPGRLLGYGSIIIIGTGGSKDPFINIPRPLHFRKVVQQEIDYAEERFRPH